MDRLFGHWGRRFAILGLAAGLAGCQTLRVRDEPQVLSPTFRTAAGQAFFLRQAGQNVLSLHLGNFNKSLKSSLPASPVRLLAVGEGPSGVTQVIAASAVANCSLTPIRYSITPQGSVSFVPIGKCGSRFSIEDGRRGQALIAIEQRLNGDRIRWELVENGQPRLAPDRAVEPTVQSGPVEPPKPQVTPKAPVKPYGGAPAPAPTLVRPQGVSSGAKPTPVTIPIPAPPLTRPK